MGVDLSKLRRGAEAIKEAAENKGGGNFQPFVPQIAWKDGDEKYVLFLNPLTEIPTVDLHEWIECGTKEFGDKKFTDFYFGISRTYLGEDVDPLTEKGSVPKTRCLAVAVELEPILQDNGRGRARPAGFTVKTMTYDRKTDDGTETVTAPVIGVVTQAPGNFYNVLRSYDETEAAIEELPLKIKREGGDKDTKYHFVPYLDQPVELDALVDNAEGISYLSRDEELWAELQDKISKADDEAEKAHIIAVALLEKRINELADYDLYKEKTDHIVEVKSKYGGGDKKKGGARAERPARPAQRAASDDDAPKTRRTRGFEALQAAAAQAE